MHEVVVYSREGCHLCDVVKETLVGLAGEAQFEWKEIDIDNDPELLAKFNDQVPVVFIDGRESFQVPDEPRAVFESAGGKGEVATRNSDLIRGSALLDVDSTRRPICEVFSDLSSRLRCLFLQRR